MSYTIATTKYGTNVAANPAYSGTFIPEIWSGKMIEKFYDATVIGAIANTNWEGEIKNQGDKVTIRTKPNISINAYEADGSLTYERPSSNVVELLIDKGYYWNTILDDVMEVQADINQMSIWAEDASEQMKIQIDTEVLAYIPGQIDSDNVGATAGRLSGDINLGASSSPLEISKDGATTGETEVLDSIIRLGQVLDEQNIPESGRWLIIPAWFSALLKNSDLRQANTMGDSTSVFRNGMLGTLDRFTVYSSNLLPTATESGGDATYIMAGHSHGLTFASQLSKVETLRAESTFGQIMRGLQVYGRKVVDGKSIAALYARKTTL
jgi:hypothetical protein